MSTADLLGYGRIRRMASVGVAAAEDGVDVEDPGLAIRCHEDPPTADAGAVITLERSAQRANARVVQGLIGALEIKQCRLETLPSGCVEPQILLLR